jgi:hypothetical protein
MVYNTKYCDQKWSLNQEKGYDMTQKQWLMDHEHLWDIVFALGTEIERIQANGIVDSLHLKKLEELRELFKAMIESAEWEYDEETGERLRPSERVMLSLVPHSGEWWSDPYAVVPVAGQTMGKQRWAVVEKGSVRAVGEKTYPQKTHAYRACRRLNDAARQVFEDKRGWFPTPTLGTEEEARV